MGIRLSPLGVAVFALLTVGVLYHFYSGFLAGKIAIFRKMPGSDRIDLREMLALSVEAAVRGGEEVKRVMEEGELHGKIKGKTKEGADEILTNGDLQSHQKMYHLIKNTFPSIQVSAGAPARQCGRYNRCFFLGGREGGRCSETFNWISR